MEKEKKGEEEEREENNDTLDTRRQRTTCRRAPGYFTTTRGSNIYSDSTVYLSYVFVNVSLPGGGKRRKEKRIIYNIHISTYTH